MASFNTFSKYSNPMYRPKCRTENILIPTSHENAKIHKYYIALQQSAIGHCLGIPVFGNHVLNDQDWHQQVSDYKQTSRPPTTKPLVWIWRQASVMQRSHSNSYGWRHAHGWLITIVVKLLIHFSQIVCISFSFHSQSIVSILFTEATISAIRVSNAYSILRDLR